jgi:hypothetical protein
MLDKAFEFIDRQNNPSAFVRAVQSISKWQQLADWLLFSLFLFFFFFAVLLNAENINCNIGSIPRYAVWYLVYCGSI